MASIVHIAGAQVQVGPRLRQRCSWCGALLEDIDLNASAGTEPGPPPTWEQGSLVRTDGHLMMVLEHEQGADIPADCCARLDDAVTA